ncbi:MAG: STN domain-containing protein, partial [Sphingobium sp.]
MVRKADLLTVAAPFFASVAILATPAYGADRQDIVIAPGRLGEAAIALGRQTGVNIGISDQSLAAIATPAVKGRLSAEAALRRLLKGSGAQAVRVAGNGWRIIRAPRAAPLPVK